jgi:DNA-directed RNA polymerase subunit F
MLGKKREDSKSISLAQAKDILQKRSKEADFGYEQQTSLDYVNQHCKLKLEDAAELEQKLDEIAQLSPESSSKVIDLLPEFKSTLNILLTKDRVGITDEQVDKILDLIKEYRYKMIEPPPKIDPKPPEQENDVQEDKKEKENEELEDSS